MHGSFDAHHHQHLKISPLPGFTGSILPGISIKCACGAPGIASETDRGFRGSRDQGNNGVEDHNKQWEEEQEEDEEEHIENALQAAADVVDIMMAMNSIGLMYFRPVKTLILFIICYFCKDQANEYYHLL